MKVSVHELAGILAGIGEVESLEGLAHALVNHTRIAIIHRKDQLCDESSVERWAENSDGLMVPVISRIHTIPLESGDLMHCAQQTCWCSPWIESGQPLIVNHNALTKNIEGWVLIGEHALPLPSGEVE